MLLENKVAAVYGAGGSIGGAVARAFAREGAKVFLAGRTYSSLDKVADEIRSEGGTAEVAVVDALDEQAVEKYVAETVKKAGCLDISFNLISVGDVQKPLLELSVKDFMQPIMNEMRTQFLTTQAAARYMVRRGSGVILYFGGGGPQTQSGLGGFKIALDAKEGLRRQWAMELGQYGIRVLTLKTGGIPESIPEYAPERDEIINNLLPKTLLHRAATLEDVG